MKAALQWWWGWLKVTLRFTRIVAAEKFESYPCCGHCGDGPHPDHLHFADCTACRYDGEIHDEAHADAG